ncbi:hypothetical protein HQ576_15730, partial [bacterium]|nr:hypothetical protein [bacterium]
MLRSCIVAFLALATTAHAAELHNPVLALPLMTKAPAIDGTIHEAEWAQATRQIGLASHRSKRLSHRESIFWLGSDGKHIFVAVRSELPPEGALLSRVRPRGDVDVQVYRDDNIELWFDPFRGDKARKRLLYQFLINSLGAQYDIAHDHSGGMTSTAWRAERRFANQQHDGWWHTELAIPIAALGVAGPLEGQEWGLRVCRNWQQPWEQTCWSPKALAFREPATMPQVRWTKAAPIVQMLQIGDRKTHKAVLALRLTNPTQAAMPLRVALANKHRDSPANERAEALALAPGEARTVALNGSSYPQGDNVASIRVTSPDAKTTYFLRDFVWTLDRPAERWRVAVHEREAIDLAFGYYPYHNQIKARLDVSNLAAAKQVTGATLVVRAKGSDKAITTAPFPALEDGRAEVVADLPDLPDGTYEALATLAGKDVPAQSPAKEFVRKHFAWERNRLGITDRVMPPFTPLRLHSVTTVSAVLRDHVMNEQGLWSQVVSKGTPLLAAPMRFEAIGPNGEPLVLKPRGISFPERSDVALTAKAGWTAGPLDARVTCAYEMDGMMKVTLDLAPAGDQPVTGLDLVIPLRDDVAKLMHVCGDGLRFNYGGATPEGEGLVWDSRKASRLEVAGTFIPYVWLGGEERGVAWFADSDRDWRLDDKKPALELSRRKGVVELRVHFINTPGPLARKRRIVFGLQATPTKPMMDTPSWRRVNSLVGRAPVFLRYHVLGATFYWGGVSYDVFPKDKDYSIFQEFARIRRTGEVNREFFKKWLLKYGPDGQREKKWDAHIWSGAHSFKGQPDSMIPYTNARGIGPCEEYTVFQDEWLLSDYTPRRGAAVAYDVDPCESFQDFACHYFGKALDLGTFDGIYFDNTFLKANKDIVAGGAYLRDDGTLQPSCGLWTMREYLKRVAILAWQKGRPFTNVSHMTNTQIAPINTWAGINLCWEWRYGDTDCHDRFAADYNRAVCIGLQTGSRPTALLGLHATKKQLQPWVARTCLAWTLVHEIYPAWSYGEPFQSVYQRLYDFGYGTGQCHVYPYWKPRPPRAHT